jgi:hypothetical protein
MGDSLTHSRPGGALFLAPTQWELLFGERIRFLRNRIERGARLPRETGVFAAEFHESGDLIELFEGARGVENPGFDLA